MTGAEQARTLVEKADEDIHVLRVLCGDRLTTDAVWGFHGQQAVEKLLKALLACRGIGFPFTHRLLELGDKLAGFDAVCGGISVFGVGGEPGGIAAGSSRHSAAYRGIA